MKRAWIAIVALMLFGCGKGDDNLGKITVDVVTQRDKVEAYDEAKKEIGAINTQREDELNELDKF